MRERERRGENAKFSLRLLFSKYIRWHLVKADHIYNKIAVRIKWPLVFCFLFNLRARIRKKDVRFYYKKIEDIFIAKSQKYEYFFFSKYQNYNCYQNGIEERGISLGEAYFLNKIKFSDNDTIIDCGANVGDLKIYFDNKKLNINYIGIEPSPKEYYCLSKNVAPSVTHNIGLWYENNNLDFYVSSHNADSSFFKPTNYNEKITISAKRLDSFFDNDIRLLKIEAEGAEPEVLIGCKRLLTKVDYISADLGFERGVLQESTLVPVTNFLLKHNFELLDFSSPRICALYKRIGI
jgi:hypothetical protein